MWRYRILISIVFVTVAFQAGETVAGLSSLQRTAITPELPHSIRAKPAPGTFLVAKRALDGSYFGQTVIYLVEHDDQGTLGLIVNRSSEIRLTDALPDIEAGETEHRLYLGGPVEPSVIMMLLRSHTAARGMAHVADSVYVSADRRVLEAALAADRQPHELRLYLGYSGWAAGQLDGELERGSWHVVAAEPGAIFATDSDSLWQRLIDRLEPPGIQVLNGNRLQALVSHLPIRLCSETCIYLESVQGFHPDSDFFRAWF